MNDLRVDWMILVVAIILGILFRKKNWYPELSSLPYFLIFTICIELIGRYYRLRSINNVPLFNMFSVLQLCYFTWLIFRIQKKAYIRSFIILVPLICLINIIGIQGLKTFHTYSYSISIILIVWLCIDYYIVTFKKADVENLLKEPNFWFITALLTYYTTSISILGILNYISGLPPEIIKLTRKILLNVNSIFYTLLIVAFLCKIPIQKFIRNS